jgi:hypothetical protein
MGYNLLWRSAEFDVLPACKQNNISILAYSPLQQGLLTGRFSTVDEVPMGRKLSKLFNASRYVKIIWMALDVYCVYIYFYSSDTVKLNNMPFWLISGLIFSTHQSTMRIFFKTSIHHELLSNWSVYLTGLRVIEWSKINEC